MDGFSSHEHILVIASTNRLEMIDSALLRAGRFDLKIRVPLPSERDRLAILKHHLRGKKSVVSEECLKRAMGKVVDWSGADLENLANEAVYTALRLGLSEITEETFNLTLHKLMQQQSSFH
jgi:ATP-dependent 26S proteasome regulatory subunit